MAYRSNKRTTHSTVSHEPATVADDVASVVIATHFK
eukprot:CAMPEP_0182526168 /NCGR_PEP_ID=MMETSP1323-20130603/2994_1 /TAXON_ID=236787 /ORGANISM="Florenciella parvula, Strain RCC1693" /LENGTH=35 /DNA_ID= /DNA_START= /DNA_END= /DNA_ORIENTATION=